jgi:hypothetical protein
VTRAELLLLEVLEELFGLDAFDFLLREEEDLLFTFLVFLTSKAAMLSSESFLA